MTTHTQQKRTDRDSTAHYRAMSRAATWSVVLGIASVASALHWAFLLVPLAGIYLAVAAKRHIREAPEELTGLAVARTGMCLSVLMGIAGAGWLITAGAARVPHGYEEVRYEILQPDPNVKGQFIPPEALELHDKKIFVEGFILPGGSVSRLKRFILCPRIANCNFCTVDPKPTEMIQIELEGDLAIDYTIHLVQLGGTFEADPNPIDGLPYRMKVDYLR